MWVVHIKIISKKKLDPNTHIWNIVDQHKMYKTKEYPNYLLKRKIEYWPRFGDLQSIGPEQKTIEFSVVPKNVQPFRRFNYNVKSLFIDFSIIDMSVKSVNYMIFVVDHPGDVLFGKLLTTGFRIAEPNDISNGKYRMDLDDFDLTDPLYKQSTVFIYDNCNFVKTKNKLAEFLDADLNDAIESYLLM